MLIFSEKQNFYNGAVAHNCYINITNPRVSFTKYAKNNE